MNIKQSLLQTIHKHGWAKTGEFTLSSGLKSDFYVDLRPMILDSRYMHFATYGLIPLLKYKKGDLLCGIATSGLFLCGSLLQRLSSSGTDLAAIYCRTSHRTHGEKKDIEGSWVVGQRVILIDDVSTTGGSLLKVIDILRKNGLIVEQALVILDREEGAVSALERKGVILKSVIKRSDLHVLQSSRMEDAELSCSVQ